MSHRFGEALIMALCCCLLVVLSMIYPAATFQADVNSTTKSVVFSRGLPRISIKISQQQKPNLKLQETKIQRNGSGILLDRRILTSGRCSGRDISIFQSQRGQASGVPQFSVQIVNNCVSSCAPWNIHISCGWFASASALNPNLFQRIAYNDCIVNGGSMEYGQILTFTYANSFIYPLSFKSANFCK